MVSNHDPKTDRSFSCWATRCAVLVAIVVILAAGTGTLMGFAARQSWRLELASHFRVQYFWALIGAVLVLIVVQQRILALVAAALAGANLVLIVPLFFGPVPRADVGPRLRAMAFNVHYLNQRYASTLDLIETERPDFVLLQEVTPEWEEAIEFLEDDYPYRHVISRDSSDGLALLSRHEITDLETHYSPGVGLPTIVAEVAVPGGSLTLVGTHPASPSTPENFDERNRQLEQIGCLVRARSGAVIVLGDLNTTTWSPYFQELLAESGLRDGRRGFGVEASWPSLSPALLRIPIDHCLVSPAVSVQDWRIGPAAGSDHRPILVDFAISLR